MRLIGEVGSSEDGMLLRAYLLQNGIDSEIEQERSGKFSVWIVDEDKLGLAADLIQKFHSQDDKSIYREAVFHAKVIEQAKKLNKINISKIKETLEQDGVTGMAQQ